MNRFEQQIAGFVASHRLMEAQGSYLVALSGGADSVALLTVLRRLGFRLEAVHCNFKLRGEESERDEQFCVALCRQYEVPLHRIHFDTRTYAQLHHVSIEMAARDLRYRYFEQLRTDLGADGICVAHHRDDSVETLLMNLVRGTGVRGLQGISPRNGHVLRPLLGVGRADVEQYLRELGQPYVTDSTNGVPDVVRNKIRLQVLPLLEQINPSVREHLAQTAAYMRETAALLEAELSKEEQQVSDGTSIDIQRLMASSAPRTLLFRLLSRYGFSSAVVSQVYEALPGESGRVWSSSSHEVCVNRGCLVVEARPQTAPKTMKIPEPGTYLYGDTRRFRFALSPMEPSFRPSKAASCVTLDARKVTFPLCIRSVQAGDRFVPFGMTGSRLLSDFLTDLKLSVFEKRWQLVVADARGIIVWVVGHRTDNRCRVEPTSRQVLSISVEDEAPLNSEKS